MSTDEKIKDERDYWIAQQVSPVDVYLHVCESPIEQLFLLSLVNYADWQLGCGDDYAFSNAFDAVPSVAACAAKKPPRDRGIWGLSETYGQGSAVGAIQLPVLLGQTEVRVDFAFLFRGVRLVVELDGHDFHEKTKEQAKKEKSRQRLLTADGWHVLRFTGSEVYGDALGCIHELLDAAQRLEDAAGRRVK